MKLKIKKWDPRTLSPTSTILLVGKRGTGKSTLLKEICYWFAQTGKINLAIGMSPTEESSENLGSFLPPCMIHTEYNETAVKELLETQKRQWKRGHGSNVLLLLDDVCYDKSVLRSKTIRQLFMNGRHRRCGLILCMQYVLDMPPDLRSNIDVCLALRDNIHSSREKLWKNFFGFFATYGEFSKVMDACTENFEALTYANNVSPTNNIEDSVFWYKANPTTPAFRLGDPVYWKLHNRYYHDREDEFDDIAMKQDRAKKLRDGKIEEVEKNTSTTASMAVMQTCKLPTAPVKGKIRGRKHHTQLPQLYQ